MLATVNRLRSTEEYDKIKNKGKLIQSQNFGVAYLKKENEEPNKFGFVISLKISKLATQRNRLRRAMEESIRQNLTFIKKGYDMVFLAKPSLANKMTDEIMKEVKLFLNREEFRT